MKRIKVSEATEIQLDWLVAKCEKRDASPMRIGGPVHLFRTVGYDPSPYQPTSDWSIGGPIIEKKKIDLEFMDNFEAWCGSIVREYGQDRESYSDDQDRESYTAEQESFVGYGPTPLIAVCRCYIASKMGDVVEVPEELT